LNSASLIVQLVNSVLRFDADVISKVEHYLGGKLDKPPAIHLVRDVAPSKLMLCVSFRIPKAVAFWRRSAKTDGAVHITQQSNEEPQSPSITYDAPCPISRSPNSAQEVSSLKRQKIEQSEPV
jgi:hypothetical protein